MSIFIAFLGGMLTLLSPCTLPVIPLLFASVRGRRGQLAIMLAGMALMFGAVSWLVTVASGWVVNLTLAGRGLALAFFALVGLSLLSQRVAQRLTSPLVALGNQLNNASSRQRGWNGSLLAGLAVGLLWAPCAGPVLGAILSLGFVHPGQATTGGLLLAYGSGGALMLFLLVRRGVDFPSASWAGVRRTATPAGGGGDAGLGGADRQRRRSLSAKCGRLESGAGAAAGRPSAAAGAKDHPPADRRAAAQQRDALPGGRQRVAQQPGVNSGASEGQSGVGGFLDPGVHQLSAYPALRARLGEQIPRCRAGGDWRPYPGISLGAFAAAAAPGGEGRADNLPGGGG